MSEFNPAQIIELAKIIESEAERIKWDTLPLDRDTVYEMLCTGVLEAAYSTDSVEKREVMLAASVVQLVVLNFVQNIQIEMLKAQSK